MTTTYSLHMTLSKLLKPYPKAVSTVSLILALLLFALPVCVANSATKSISVDFIETDLDDCIQEILQLADVTTKIAIERGVARIVSKKATDLRWDTVLKEILKENNLRLVKQSSGYLIVDNTPVKAPINSRLKSRTLTVEQNDLTSSGDCMNDSEIITLGYKYGTGANPYAMVGKCLKLKNVTPFQYLNARQAYVRWSYRGESGTVFVEDKSESGMAINSSRVMVGRVLKTHQYGTVLRSQQIIPHLVITSE